MCGCFQRIRCIEVWRFQEIAAAFRCKEQHRTEDNQEYNDAQDVFNGVVRMEWDTIAWNTVFVFVFLISTPSGLLEPTSCRAMMCHNQAEQYQRYSDNVQGEEAVQSNVGNVEVTTDPSGQIRADNRDGGEQVNNYLRTPEGHLTPRQQVTHKGFCHQCQENQRTKNPHQFTRFFCTNRKSDHGTYADKRR